MLDVFMPLTVPGELVSRIERLERGAGKHGVVIRCRWMERRRLVTSQIEVQRWPLREPVVEDLKQLVLRLGPPNAVGSYAQAIKAFEQRALNFARATHPDLEHVSGQFGRIHLVPAFRTTAVCGQGWVNGDTVNGALTCLKCATFAASRLPTLSV